MIVALPELFSSPLFLFVKYMEIRLSKLKAERKHDEALIVFRIGQDVIVDDRF